MKCSGSGSGRRAGGVFMRAGRDEVGFGCYYHRTRENVRVIHRGGRWGQFNSFRTYDSTLCASRGARVAAILDA